MIRRVKDQLNDNKNETIDLNQPIEPVEISSRPLLEENFNIVKLTNERNEEEMMSKINKFNLVINTRNEIKNALLNDPSSLLNHNSILKKTLDCLKGDKIEIPQDKFLKVKDLAFSDINTQEMQKAKNIINLQRQFDLIKNDHDDIIMKNVIKSSQKQQEVFNELLAKSKESMINIEKANKISEDVISQLKIKMEEEFTKDLIKEGIERLNIRVSNFDSIQTQLNNISEEQNIVNANERIKIIEENNRRAEIEVRDFLRSQGIESSNESIIKQSNEPEELTNVLSDEMIEKLYKKFKPNKKKSKTKTIKPTFNKFKLK